MVKVTNFDGVYSSASKNDDKTIEYKKIKAMNSTSTPMCMDNIISIIVINVNNKNNLMDSLLGKK